jgi:hypothetical protein
MRECARSDGLSERKCLRELREGVADRAERLQHFGDDEGAVGKVDVHIVLHAPTHRRQPIEPNTRSSVSRICNHPSQRNHVPRWLQPVSVPNLRVADRTVIFEQLEVRVQPRDRQHVSLVDRPEPVAARRHVHLRRCGVRSVLQHLLLERQQLPISNEIQRTPGTPRIRARTARAWYGSILRW